MSSNTLKECFEVESKLEAFYTGGNIVWSDNYEDLFCQNKGFVSLVSVTKGTERVKIGTLEEFIDEDTINTFAASCDGKSVVTHHKSSLFKLWKTDAEKMQPTKVWKSVHNGPVAGIALGRDASRMASGGADGAVRLWDLEHHSCTNNLKGAQGVVGVILYHPDESKGLVFASADDYVIHGWSVKNGKEVIRLEGHFSKVTSLSFHDDGIHAVSSGRDKVLILWDLAKKVSLNVLPVYECIEGAFVVPADVAFPVPEAKRKSSIYAASAGEKGVLKIWEMKSGQLVYEQTNSLIPAAAEENGLAVKSLLYNKESNCVAMVSTSHNILVYSLESFECKKQLIGFIDEVLDMAYLGKDDSHLAVATNTADIKLYNLSTMNCQILAGHKNIVLSLATSAAKRNLLLSSDKDNCVRLWLMSEADEKVRCVGVGTRHTSAVGCVALAQAEAKFFVSVSQDCCLKMWQVPENLTPTEGGELTLNATHTVVAHEKDINSVAVSPNDKVIATGSQDKTAKLWSAENLEALGVLRGHQRGVWCVRFSPLDQVLATSSADCRIKLWSLTDLSCLKTLEGHEAAVLKIEFLTRGMQIISAAADGLLKLWVIKTSEYTTTLDQHDDRVWSITVNSSETHFVSGGSDSKLVIWRDSTKEKRDREDAERERMILDEQDLANYLHTENLTKALLLALRLKKPMKVLEIVENLIKQGQDELKTAVCNLEATQLEELMDCAVEWNINARNYIPAQMIVYIMLREIGMDNLSREVREKLISMQPYTERHFKRVTQLYQDLHLLTYVVGNMKTHGATKEGQTDDAAAADEDEKEGAEAAAAAAAAEAQQQQPVDT